MRAVASLAVFAALIATAFAACSDYQTFETCVGQRDVAGGSFCAWCQMSVNVVASCIVESDTARANCAAYAPYAVQGTDGNTYFKSQAYGAKASTGESSISEISVALRPGEQVSFTMQVKPNRCKGIDLYYLMDVTGSMRDDKASLEQLAPRLASKTQSLCNIPACSGIGLGVNCGQIGFGTFVDKPVSPIGYWEANSDADKTVYGDVPGKALFTTQTSKDPFNFVFRNNYPLGKAGDSASVTAFQNAVKNAQITENIDYPEAPLEALVQAAACDTSVGWRSASQVRRMIFLATDADPHIAGDGLKAGIFKANDLTCRGGSLRDQNLRAIDQDYPSLGQVAEVLVSRNIYPIFAYPNTKAPKSQYEFEAPNEVVYPSVVKAMNLGSSVTISDNSDNVEAALEQGFNQVLQGVSLLFSAQVPGITVTSTPSQVTLAWNQPTTFTVTLAMDKDAVPDVTRKITATPVGFESFDINIVTQPKFTTCTAQSQPNFFKTNCNKGTATCGRCSCQDGYSGDFCNCQNDRSACLSNGLLCSNQGDCVCGQCVCYPPIDVNIRGVVKRVTYTGSLCNCTKYDCPESNGQQCGGPSAGTCGCDGVCSCLGGRTGAACECTAANTCSDSPNNCVNGQCRSSGTCAVLGCECNYGWQRDANNKCTVPVYQCPWGRNGVECSGHGTCNQNTGKCVCNQGWADIGTDDPCACDQTKTCKNNCFSGAGQGTCTCGTCVCDDKFRLDGAPADYDCSCSAAPCPNDCNGNGQCVCGKCQCRDPFIGDDCSRNCTNFYRAPGNKLTKADLNCRDGFDEMCGVCICADGFTGPDCRCSTKECISETAEDCSGHGTCQCGTCSCQADYDSAQVGCACKTTTPCPVDEKGLQCGGPSRGTCIKGKYDPFYRVICGECECAYNTTASGEKVPLWTGPACNCSTAACATSDEDGNPECGSQGSCVCGACVCNEGFQKDVNGVCPQKCDATKKCPKNEAGVECNGHGTCNCGSCECESLWDGVGCEFCKSIDCYNCTSYSLCNDCTQQTDFCVLCGMKDLTGGLISSKCIKANDNATVCDVKYTSTTQCQVGSSGGVSTTTKIGVGVGVGAGLACAGVAGIVGFKLYQRHLDKKEWERFEKERQRSEWKADQNPLYQSSVRETENPLYVGKS